MGEFERIGEALKILRIKSGLKQREVGTRAGVTPAMISTYETGKAIPLIPTVEGLLAAMGFSRFDLLNALETANGRPEREFPEVNRTRGATEVLKDLGVEHLTEEEEEVFIDTLQAVCRTLKLARRTSWPSPALVPEPTVTNGAERPEPSN